MKSKCHQVERVTHPFVIHVALDVSEQRRRGFLASFRESSGGDGVESLEADRRKRIASEVSTKTLREYFRVKDRVNHPLSVAHVTHLRGQELGERRLLLNEVAEGNLRVVRGFLHALGHFGHNVSDESFFHNHILSGEGAQRRQVSPML